MLHGTERCIVFLPLFWLPLAWRGATQGEGCEFEPPEAEPFDIEGAVPLEVCAREREMVLRDVQTRKGSSERSAPDHRVMRKPTDRI